MNKVVNHISIILIFLIGILSFDTLSAQNIIKPHPSERDDIFIRCEVMPRFPGCEDIEGTNEDKAKCAEEKMLDYIYSNLKYPEDAIKNRKEGQVVLKMVINTEGKIEYIQILRSPDLSLSKAAEEVVMSMNDLPEKWNPGIQRGKEVDAWYTLPIKFELDEVDKRKNRRYK